MTEADIISCVEFNHDGELLATGDKGGRVVIFQRDPISKAALPRRGEYNVYSTFQVRLIGPARSAIANSGFTVA